MDVNCLSHLPQLVLEAFVTDDHSERGESGVEVDTDQTQQVHQIPGQVVLVVGEVISEEADPVRRPQYSKLRHQDQSYLSHGSPSPHALLQGGYADAAVRSS